MLTLREMQPADGPALKHLMENDPPSRGMAMTTRFLVDPYEAWTTLRSDMIGVVIDAPDGDGVIGTATAAFEDIQFEGRVLPSVNLENVKVHHAYRGKGLGAQLMLGLVERGRARFGDDAVILSGTITSNVASQATMNKWASQFVSRIVVSPRGTRSRPPRPLDSVSVRPAAPGDFAEIAAKSNRYFADYNLYPPLSAEKLATALNAVRQYWIAVDRAGNVLAGVRLSDRGQLMVDDFKNIPLPIRVANVVLRAIPPDRTMRLMEGAYMWFDNLAVARYLWQTIRWQFRDQNSSIDLAHDPRSPMPDVLGVKAWHLKFDIVYGINGPVPMSEDRLMCGFLRG